MSKVHRQTKIIFTIGPATEDEEMIAALIERQVDICRLNMAHANHTWTREIIDRIHKVCNKTGRQIAIMMDVKGPEIRTGVVGETLQLERGEPFDFFPDPERVEELKEEGVRGVSVNYPGLAKDLKVGDTVLVDSGLIRMRVLEVRPERIRCEVRIPGPMGNRRHINLPGTKINLPCLTTKDKEDILVGIEKGVDFYALSFVREPSDIDIMRRFVSDNGSKAGIIAKIEDQTAIANLNDIIKASDGLMVARGDLGIEIPYETLPVVQRRAVKSCLSMGKPVIVATHMLESMITQPMPTRAEITDVANAVSEQADCVMLSGETTVGQYPLECVEVLNRIALTMEEQQTKPYNTDLKLKTAKALMLRSAVMLCDEIDGAGLVIFTRSGYGAQTVSALRPRNSPIFAFTDVPRILRQMLIMRGVEPFLMDFEDDPEVTIVNAVERIKRSGWTSQGKSLVILSNALAGKRIIETLQVRTVE